MKLLCYDAIYLDEGAGDMKIVVKARPASRAALWVALSGAFGMMISPHLPWVTVGRDRISGVIATHGGAETLFLIGVVLAVRFIIALVRNRYVSRAWTIIPGAFSLAFVTYLYNTMLNDFKQAGLNGQSPVVEPGLTLSMMACFVVFVSSAKLGKGSEEDQDPNKSDPASA